MPFKIDRVPQGLLNLLATRGGLTPAELEDRIQGTLDLLQFYGLQQIRTIANGNAAVAENGNVALAGGVLSTGWCVLYNSSATFIKTATMTALRGAILINRTGGAGGAIAVYASQELGPYGATQSGACSVVFNPSIPMLLPPATSILAIPQIIGTDATVDVTLEAEIGVIQ